MEDTPTSSQADQAKRSRARLVVLAAGLLLAVIVWCVSRRDAVSVTWQRLSTRWQQRRATRRLLRAPALPAGIVHKDGRLIRQKDGAEMVLIPAGEFAMGGQGDPDERPMRDVYLDAYLIDKLEATNRQFKCFIDACPEWTPSRVQRDDLPEPYLPHWRDDTCPPSRERHPVHHVSWEGAQAYARWAGAALPTEAQWEKAARGGLRDRRYPWGDERDPRMANWGRARWPHLKPGKPIVEGDFHRARLDNQSTAAVGSFPANASGLHDMVGNVWEWCADWYAPDFYRTAPSRNPTGPAEAVLFRFLGWDLHVTARCVRGGSWYRRPYLCRSGNRSYDHFAAPISQLTEYYYGFRCVVPLDVDFRRARNTMP